MQQDETLTSGKVALAGHPVRQQDPPQTHQQRHHYRCRETPARSHAGLHQRRRRIPGEAALESRTHATQDDWTMTRIEIHKGLPDLQCWSGAGCLDTAKALPQLGFISSIPLRRPAGGAAHWRPSRPATQRPLTVQPRVPSAASPGRSRLVARAQRQTPRSTRHGQD